MKRSIFLVCFVVFGVVSLSAIGSIVSVAQSGWQTDSISYGISRMVDIASLPLLDRGISVHYEGSIDKRGKNADWDWSLYQDQRGEWVIFDVDGPGPESGCMPTEKAAGKMINPASIATKVSMIPTLKAVLVRLVSLLK